MICKPCQEAAQMADATPGWSIEQVKGMHAECKGGTHCDCQHIPTVKQADGGRAPRRS
jgi:hypothetical protein